MPKTKPTNGSTAILGFEATLWRAAVGRPAKLNRALRGIDARFQQDHSFRGA